MNELGPEAVQLSAFSLVIDTSICGLRFGLVADGADEATWLGGIDEAQGSAARLTGILNDGLKVCGLTAHAIKRTLVSCGPGSFTGIRVGIAFARGLSAGREMAAVGCSSLSLYAAALCYRRGGPVAVYLPATRSAGYVVVAHSPDDLRMQPISVEDCSEFLADFPEDFFIVIAGGWPALTETFDQIGKAYTIETASSIADAACFEMCRLVACGQAFEGGLGLEPIYLRRSSVEEKGNFVAK